MTPIEEIRYQFKAETISANILFLIFITIIICVYIYNHHWADNTIRDISKIKTELKELKWEYIDNKNELENKSIQTEMATIAAPLGLHELTTPPQKLQITVVSEH